MVDYREFSKQIKEKYPEYANIDDEKLAKAMVEKYPVYKEQVSFKPSEPVRPRSKGLFSPMTNDDIKEYYQNELDKRKGWEENHPFISSLQKDFQPGYRAQTIDLEQGAKYGLKVPFGEGLKNDFKKFGQNLIPAANITTAIGTGGMLNGAKGLLPAIGRGAAQGAIQGGVLGVTHELGDNGLSLNVVPETLKGIKIGAFAGGLLPIGLTAGGKAIGATGDLLKRGVGKLAQISPETVEQVIKPTSKALDYTKEKAQDVLRSTTERVRNAYNNLLSKKGEAISAAEENLRNIPERVNVDDITGDIRGIFDKYQGENINPARNMAGNLEENLIDLVNSGKPVSILEQDKTNYLNKLNDFKLGKLQSDELIDVVSETPQIWQDYGVPNAKMSISQDTYKKAGNLPNRFKKNHNLGDDILKNLPELLQDPQYIFNSNSVNGRYVGILNALDNEGRPVLVAIEPANGQLKVNLLPSLYGRNNFSNFLAKQTKKGNLLFDKSKTPPQTTSATIAQASGDVPTNSITDNDAYFNSLSPIDLQKLKQQVGQMTNWQDTTRPKIQNTILEQVYGKMKNRLEDLSPELADANAEYAYLKGFQNDEGLKTILAPGGAIDRASTALKNYNSTVSKGNTAQNIQALEKTLTDAGEKPFLNTMDDINAAMDLLKHEKTGLGSIAELGKSIVTRPALKAARWYNSSRLPQALGGVRNVLRRAAVPLINTPLLYGGISNDDEYYDE